MNLEYYYLFGLDIPLERHSLGNIRQPRLKDYIFNDCSIEDFYFPFIVNDILIYKSDSHNEIMELRDKLGSLTFLLFNVIQFQRKDILDSLKLSLRMIYGSDDINIDFDKFIITVNDVLITNDNFNYLSDLILEMLKIDKSKLNLDKKSKKELSEIEREFERRRRKSEEKGNSKKKKEGFTILDICNVVIHSGLFKYEEVLNMSVYQIKNSFDAISNKESYIKSTLIDISPKFDTSKKKDVTQHWIEKIKLDKSTLSHND